MITLTTNEIAKHEPSPIFYTKYLPALGKDKPDDEPLTFAQLAKVASFDDIIWFFKFLDHKHIDKIIEFARRCADRVAYLISDDNLSAKRAMEFANTADAVNAVNAVNAAGAINGVAGAVSWSVYYAAKAAADAAMEDVADFVWTNNIMVAIASASRAAKEKEQAEQLKILLEIMS